VVVPSTARYCPSCGNPISAERRAEERKLATVLFADLVGSTALADSTDAERTRALLNRFYDVMAAEIADMGGTVEKFIGDAVVAAFGAPAIEKPFPLGAVTQTSPKAQKGEERRSWAGRTGKRP
jgi:class 3 adenylate cyclase